MPILRHEHEKEFTVLPNSLIRNTALSLRDVGLLCYMLSLPADWDFSIQGMVSVLQHDGRDAVKASLTRLQKMGYVQIQRGRDPKGRLLPAVWKVSDLIMNPPDPDNPQTAEPYVAEPYVAEPYVAEPCVAEPCVAEPCVANPLQTKNIRNKEQKNKEKKNKEEREQSPSTNPSLQDVKTYIRENGMGFDGERFFDYYSARGWKVGNTRIADWTALARLWQRMEKKDGGTAVGKNEVEYPWHIGSEV